MQSSFNKIIQGYQKFRAKYGASDSSVMQQLANSGQQPEVMVVACCDSRVDPALVLQCDPGDLFVVRNVANIVPPYENDEYHHGTSAALEFAVRRLEVKHLIILGHSQCGGIENLLAHDCALHDDFVANWLKLIKVPKSLSHNADDYAKLALLQSYDNCLTFPWIKSKMASGELKIHLWFFHIKEAQIYSYDHESTKFTPLSLS